MKKPRPFWFLHNKISPLKKAVNYAFWSFVFFGVYFFFIAIFGALEHAAFFGLMALLNAMFIAIPSFLFLKTWVEKIYNIHLIVSLEAIVVFTLIMNSLGTAGLYNLGVGYDSFLHFINSLIYAVLFYLVFYVVMEKYFLRVNKPALFFLPIIIVFIIGIGWEWFEVVGDRIFNTKMAGDPYAFESYQLDTLKDIIYNTIGSLVGVILTSLYGERWLKGLKKQKNWRKFVMRIREIKKKNKNFKK